MHDEIIQLKVSEHDKRIELHDKRLDKLEHYKSKTEAKIESLCEQITSLVVTMRWFIGLLVGSFASFFFYSIQQGLFK
ncbi:hemolysin XhlA family protein [Clostridium malenominatum]|uniref:Hemolysin XhlA family protein n=1 Tax=Clostridium malenominatum TaxID=1539 RepID=A0ABN1IMV8_9CLOT